MTDFVYAGTGEGTYPTLRDSAGVLVNLAVPGDVRDFSEAPDHMWRDLTDGDRARIAAVKAEEAAAEAEAALAEVVASEGDAPAVTPAPVPAPVPVPAAFPVPPAVIPAVPIIPSTAGVTGSEES